MEKNAQFWLQWLLFLWAISDITYIRLFYLFQVFIEGAHDIYYIAVQRLVQGTLKWKTLFKINNRQWTRHDSGGMVSYHELLDEK